MFLSEAPRRADAPILGRVERASPGISTLLEGVAEDGSHSVLDLGHAFASSFRVYGLFAQRIRFADLLGVVASSGKPLSAREALPAQPELPYNLVFAWDVLSWLTPEERTQVVARLAEITAPNARLFLAVEESSEPTARPLRFGLLDTGHMRFEPAGPARPAGPCLLPGEVERVLRPFRVVHAYTSQVGLREYVALRGEGELT